MGQELADGWIAYQVALEAVQQGASERAVLPNARPPTAAVHHERHLVAGADVCDAG